jgi:hypothetical protein
MAKRKRISSTRDICDNGDFSGSELESSPSAAQTGQKKVRWEGNNGEESLDTVEDASDEEADSQVAESEKVSYKAPLVGHRLSHVESDLFSGILSSVCYLNYTFMDSSDPFKWTGGLCVL